MAEVDTIRNRLIDKILSVKDKKLLMALDHLVASTQSDSNKIRVSEEQKFILQMSENDIQNGDVISQEEMHKRNLEWLNEK